MSVTIQQLFSSSLVNIFVLFVAILLKWYFSPSSTHKNIPPSPMKLPIIGNLHQLGSSPHRSLQALAKKHGSLMMLHFGRVPVLVASSADAAREILKTHDLIFANREKTSVRSILSYNEKDIACADYGEHWRKTKSLLVLKILSHKRVQFFRRMREEETDLLVQRIREINSSSTAPVINLTNLLISYTNGVICRATMGRKYDGEKFKNLFDNLSELLGGFCVGDYIPWLSFVDRLKGYHVKAVKVHAEFDEFIVGVIEEHVQRKRTTSNDGGNDNHKDFVDILLEIQNNNDPSFVVDRDSVKAIILDIITAGTDTSYSTIDWQFNVLLRNPNVLKKLQQEVREVAKGKPQLTEDDIDQMPYLMAFVKETFRMHTTVPLLFARQSTQDVNVMGYDIPEGTRVLINVWAIGRDSCSWDDPEEFRPERFLGSSIDYKGLNFELLPFGAGRRMCPAIQFAMESNNLVLASLVHKFDFTLPGSQKWEDMDMTETTGITVHKKSLLQVVATPYG